MCYYTKSSDANFFLKHQTKLKTNLIWKQQANPRLRRCRSTSAPLRTNSPSGTKWPINKLTDRGLISNTWLIWLLNVVGLQVVFKCIVIIFLLKLCLKSWINWYYNRLRQNDPTHTLHIWNPWILSPFCMSFPKLFLFLF